MVGCEIGIKGYDHDLHSAYGGCVFNRIQELVSICSSFHRREGLVDIPGFCDDVLPPQAWELKQMKRFPTLDEELKTSLGIKHFRLPDPMFSAAETMRFLPTLEFNGIKGGFQGAGMKTRIPHCASLKVSCRLVPNQNTEKIKTLLSETITSLTSKEISLSMKFEQASNPDLFHIRRNPKGFLSNVIGVTENGIQKIFGNPPIYFR